MNLGKGFRLKAFKSENFHVVKFKLTCMIAQEKCLNLKIYIRKGSERLIF